MTEIAQKHRLLFALCLVLSGIALFPFTSVSKDFFEWQGFSGIYDIDPKMVFTDGFETGGTEYWSATYPNDALVLDPAPLAKDFELLYRIDLSRLENFEDGAVELLVGLSSPTVRAFAVDFRRGKKGPELRARATLDSGEWSKTRWTAVSNDAARLSVEWRPSLEGTADGILYVSLDDELVLWLDELENSSASLKEMGRLRIDGEAILLPTGLR